RIAPEKAFDNLQKNQYVGWLIRLIPFDPKERDFSVTPPEQLGPELQKFTFVAPYEEIRGYPASEAVERFGGKARPRLFGIIFQLPPGQNIILRPANARGLLQVIRLIEADQASQIDKPLLKGTGELNTDENKELDNTDITSWAYASYKDSYNKYCTLTHKFTCNSFSAQHYLSEVSDDWHPLGFSQNHHELPCKKPVADFCTVRDWPAWKEMVFSKFGARAFLLPNLSLKSLSKPYM